MKESFLGKSFFLHVYSACPFLCPLLLSLRRKVVYVHIAHKLGTLTTEYLILSRTPFLVLVLVTCSMVSGRSPVRTSVYAGLGTYANIGICKTCLREHFG